MTGEAQFERSASLSGAALVWQSFGKMYGEASRTMVDELGYAEFERKLLSKIRAANGRPVRMRDLHRSMSKHFRNAYDLKNAIEALYQSGIIKIEEKRIPGGVARLVQMK